MFRFKIGILALFMFLGSVFFTNTTSAQVVCPTGTIEVSDQMGNIYCVDPALLTTVTTAPTVPVGLSVFSEGRNDVSLLILSSGFHLDDLIVSTTYREQLYVDPSQLFHNQNVVAFDAPVMYTRDIPTRFSVTLEPGQSAVCWNTQRVSATLYVNTTASAVTFTTGICDAVRGWTEVNSDLLTQWWEMWKTEVSRVPRYIILSLVR